MESAREVLEFSDLTPYLLLQNGNYLYKVPFRGGFAVLKVYYGSRGPVSRVVKSVENVVFAGQTSYMPMTRLRTERACMELWRKHGFRVFEIYEDVEVIAPECPPGGYLLMEYVEAPKILGYLQEPEASLDEKIELYRRFLAEWGRRHELAISLREPRLVHENGDGNHVMLAEGGFLWFDFEMVYRYRSRVRYQVAHEIVQYLWHTLKAVPQDVAEALLAETVAHYPARQHLHTAYEVFLSHPDPVHRIARALDRTFRKRASKPTSKYNVARRLRAALSQA
ncbi:hypothetical protein ACFL59_14290 [Planctomycetota bacterium]